MRLSAAAFPTRPRQRRRIFALLLPLIAYLGVFYAYPIAAMMFRSVSEPYWTIEHFAKLFSEGVYLHVLWMTVEVAAAVTLAALLLGYPVAYLLARLDRAKSNLLLILVLVPFWTSVLVRTYAWMVLLGRQGVVNQFMLAIGAIDQPLRRSSDECRHETDGAAADRRSRALLLDPADPRCRSALVFVSELSELSASRV
jgi:ABC-type spermidine/putrescine transport system permease subunit I